MDMNFFNRLFDSLPARIKTSKPDIGIVLGSGWGDALTIDCEEARVPYSKIEGLGAATVQGHAGELLLYRRKNLSVLAFCGRRHWYEGVGWEAAVSPVEVLRRLKTKRLLLTNAVGGINPALKPGDLVVLRDHINTVGANPLIGPHNKIWGERFPDMTEIYSKGFAAAIHSAARECSLRIHDGIYCFTSGPVFETPAEIKAYRAMGADVVGMSTVPEAVFAAACKFELAGISLVSNLAAGISNEPLRHEDILEATAKSKKSMSVLIDRILERISGKKRK